MPYSLKIFLFFLFLSFIYSEIQFNSCENNKRKIIFENGIIKEFSCIFCPVGQYTTYYEKNEFYNCSECESGSSNYGQDIIINSFSKKKLSRYYFTSSSKCTDNDICPEWKINPLSLRVDYTKDINKSESVFSIKQYYMNDGELIVKYINYNGGIDKYFNIYINNNLLYKDDSEHSIIKTKVFNIYKGENTIKFEYIFDNNLSLKSNSYDDDSYLEIFEIQMIKAETSSLDCAKYDSLDELKYSILNNCDYYVNKCSNDIYCTFRFYTEQKSEYCDLEGSQNISYSKINDAICQELIDPPDIEVECEHCTYGQHLLKNGEEQTKCVNCEENLYNSKIINDEETCLETCDIENKLLNKILYINHFEDPSQLILSKINIIINLGYIEVKYEKFNEKENTNIFVEINDINRNEVKTIELIDPEEENFDSDDYKFNIPIQKGEFDIQIKGKNLKLKKVSIKGSESGGNYKCVDQLNIDDEEICENEDEHYSSVKGNCTKCTEGSIIDKNKECIFINQFIDNKFILDNNLLNRKILSSTYLLSSEDKNFFLNFNPSFPLIYYTDINKDSFIIGKELYKVKLVKGIENRGIILSFSSKDNNKEFKSNIFIKCNKTISEEEKVILNNYVKEDNIEYYFFTLNSNDSCPYCLNSEINYIDNDSKCIYKKKLVEIKIKDGASCVIKSFDNSTNSKLINNSSILLNINSSEKEDKLLISNYFISENIPINYENEDDEINTLFQKNITCEYKRKNIMEMGTGVIVLIIIAGVLGLFIIGVIIWKIISSCKKKEIPERKNESLTELTESFNPTSGVSEFDKENLKNTEF